MGSCLHRGSLPTGVLGWRKSGFTFKISIEDSYKVKHDTAHKKPSLRVERGLFEGGRGTLSLAADPQAEERRRHRGDGDHCAVFHEADEGEGHAVVVELARPHNACEGTCGGEESAEVGADHG